MRKKKDEVELTIHIIIIAIFFIILFFLSVYMINKYFPTESKQICELTIDLKQVNNHFDVIEENSQNIRGHKINYLWDKCNLPISLKLQIENYSSFRPTDEILDRYTIDCVKSYMWIIYLQDKNSLIEQQITDLYDNPSIECIEQNGI